MSKAKDLINNKYYLFKMLSSKYSDIEEDYCALFNNCIIEDKPSHFLSKYKECVYCNYTEEFLRRWYSINESIDRIPRLADYYKNYLTFFCRPIFRNFRSTILIMSLCDRKAEMFYHNNYCNVKEDRNPNDQHQHHNKSNSNDIRANDNNDKEGNKNENNDNINKTIFNKSVRNCIEKSNSIRGNDSSFRSQSIILGKEKESKRSTNNSLMNILISLQVNKPNKSIKGNVNDKSKQSLSIKNSLLSTKSNHIDNSGAQYKNAIITKLIPLLPTNHKASIIEFNKTSNNPKNKTIKTTLKKNTMTNLHLNQRALSNGSKRNNSNCHKQASQSQDKNKVKKPLKAISLNPYSNNKRKETNNNTITLTHLTQITTPNNETETKTPPILLLQSKGQSKNANVNKNKAIEDLIIKQKKTFVKSQVSTSNTSKNYIANSKGRNNNNKGIFMTNTNTNTNNNSKSTLNGNTNGNVQIKNPFQDYMSFNNTISRNKKGVHSLISGRNTNKILQTENNFGATTLKATVSIDDKVPIKSQLKNILKEKKTKVNMIHNTQRQTKKDDCYFHSNKTLEVLAKLKKMNRTEERITNKANKSNGPKKN